MGKIHYIPFDIKDLGEFLPVGVLSKNDPFGDTPCEYP
jgi:hypothetical protein